MPEEELFQIVTALTKRYYENIFGINIPVSFMYVLIGIDTIGIIGLN